MERRMEKYMMLVVYMEDGELYKTVVFFDDLNSVEIARMDYTCGVGAECDVYEFNTEHGYYEFLYS